MSRVGLISPTSATGQVKDLMDTVQTKPGMVPNMMRAMANAPSVLESYLHLSNSPGSWTLSAKVREQLALAVAQANGSEYCLAAHTAICSMAGLNSDQIRDSRRGGAIDPGTEALLRFACRVVETRGHVSDRDLENVRGAGFGDSVITEVIAHVALNIFTNYFNNVVETDVDFKRAPALTPLPVAMV
jgi:uncharacterized peroxidase-related enzyme